MPLAYQIFTSPIGEILVAGSGYAVTHVMQGKDRSQLSADFRMQYDDASPIDKSGYIREACAAISSYLTGINKRIDIAFQVDGTDFQRKVWHEISQIPYGAITTYSAIAETLGTPNAFRTVANACGSNPVPLIIPCHRVVHKSSSTGDFEWGLKAKEYLLDMEAHNSVYHINQYIT